MTRIAIIGSGDLGQSIAWYANQNGFEIVGFYDDFNTTGNVNGYPILGDTEKIYGDFLTGSFDSLVCAIGYKHFSVREEIFNMYKSLGIPFATIIDSSCHVDKSAIISEGVVMFPGSFIDKNVVLEENVLLNVCSTIAHDSRIKAHTFLAPRVAVAGFTTIGRKCMIGINSTIIDNINICDNTRLGGGTTVIKNIEIPGLYVGVPAKWKKK